MRARAVVGLLTLLGLLTAAGPAEAFGRRQAYSYCHAPVYCHSDCCHYWCPPYYPPCPPWPGHHVGWDCVCNRTNLVLRVHITSGYGSFETILHPGCCAAFWFVKDGKPRVLSAFTLDNTLVDLTPFATLDQTGRPKPLCLPITQGAPAPATAAPERQRVEGAGGLPISPSGQPF